MSRREPDPRRLLDAHDAATDFYRAHLLDEPRALAYLRSRGIVAETAHSTPWTIGYAPKGWTQLRDHLYGHGFTKADLLAAGLATTARNGNVVDTFRDRVMFPIRNAAGNVVAFTGRDLSGRDDVPRYRNTTTTAIYRKSEVLYGLAEQVAHSHPALVMLVEGPADVVAVARMGVSLAHSDHSDTYLAVAPCGTALTAQQVALLAAALPPGTPVACAFDADIAGAKAIDKSYALLRDWPGPVEAITLPSGSDPAALVAANPAHARACFQHGRAPLVDLLVEHRLAPHLARLDARLEELARIKRDPGTESLIIRLDAAHAVAHLLRDVAAKDRNQGSGLALRVATRLQLDPLTVFETIYPPTDDADPPTTDETRNAQAEPTGISEGMKSTVDSATAPHARRAIPLGGAGYPDPTNVAHQYARACPADAAAATWVQHDPHTGHSAWVLAEGVGGALADRDAAHLAAQVAGRTAVLVGAHGALEIARTALRAHFAQQDRSAQGDATIIVLTSFDGDSPKPGRGRFTVAWTGDARGYASIGRWFAPLTVDHTLRAHGTVPDRRHREAMALLADAAWPGGEPGRGHRETIANAMQPLWLVGADLLDLATVWRTARGFERHLASAHVAAEAVEDRLRQLYPRAMAHYDDEVRRGVARADAMRRGSAYLPDPSRRAGDGALTSSVRGGPIGVNRIDLPTTQIVLAGRGLAGAAVDTVREAVEGHRPDIGIGNLRRLGGASTVAVVIRPRHDKARDAMTAARLAAQDQADATALTVHSGLFTGTVGRRPPLTSARSPQPARQR